MALHRYWFEFSDAGLEHEVGCTLPSPCGVTAHDRADALGQIDAQWPGELDAHHASREIEDVDLLEVSVELATQMAPIEFGDTEARGIWYPRSR